MPSNYTPIPDSANDAVESLTQTGARAQLASWIMSHVIEWENWRKQHYDAAWAEYLKKWRGLSDGSDVTRESERSRLVSPALQQAVEDAVAEIEESILGDSEAWFDIDDDKSDGVTEDWQALRVQLLDDMAIANVEGAILECCGLMGALYGTAIAKIVVDVRKERAPKTLLSVKDRSLIEGYTEQDRVHVYLEPVRPDQFVIDTAVNKPGREGIEQALGVAHRLPRPRHALRARIEAGDYWEVPLCGYSGPGPNTATEQGLLVVSDKNNTNLVTEYHGLVPKALLEAAIKDGDEVPEIDSREMVEAVCVVIDDAYLAMARENVNLLKDRDFIAAPYDLIPGSFWGRGVAEKAINSQRALDAMLRAQIDGLSYSVHPMLGVDARRRSPRHKIEVSPGNVLYVNGPPSEALMPLNFGRIDPATFTATGLLERLIQGATGTMGMIPFTPGKAPASLGVASSMQGGVMKRTRRTLRLMERHFLTPLVEKFTLRQMQWNDEVYPFIDVRFRVRTRTPMMAREMENQSLVQALNVVPPASPVFYALLGQIIENSSAKDKGRVLQLIEASVAGLLPRTEEDAKPAPEPSPLEQERELANLQEVLARTDLKKATTAEKLVKIKRMANEMNRGRDGTE